MKLYGPNPHYIEFRGAPTPLVGSGEHYGAVMNADFDYVPYLDELARHGLNKLRVFTGTGHERAAFQIIANNTMNPAPGRYVCPWQGQDAPGGKYNLDEWNPAYFARLRDFVAQAGKRNIVAQVSLFCHWYTDEQWTQSPLYPDNNVQGIGPRKRKAVHSLQNNGLLPHQEKFALKIVDELAGFDNVYFELINEPYAHSDQSFDIEFQHYIASLIAQHTRGRATPPLIALNYANRSARIEHTHPAIGIYHFHYALPEAVMWNYHLNCVLGDDETGFQGQSAAVYRREAWAFMLAGGGLYDNLDYSFTVAHPDGSAVIEANTPGYGGTDLRAQLGALKRFLNEIEVWKLKPYPNLFGWHAGAEYRPSCMADPGRLYVAYFPKVNAGEVHKLALPAGRWEIAWLNPLDAHVMTREVLQSEGGYSTFVTPWTSEDIALKVTCL